MWHYRTRWRCIVALAAIAIALASTASAGDRQSDSLVLVDLYNSTNGAYWTNNENWLTNSPIDTWDGISVSNDRVACLGMHFNNMEGPLPASLGNLDSLKFLFMNGNYLTDSIPVELGNLTHLIRLHLYNNNLVGPIPSQLGNLTSLSEFALGGNQLSDTIPASLGNLTSLHYTFKINNNQLTGEIPSSLGNFNVYEFLASNNQLSGPIPESFGQMSILESLDLSNNALTGPVPDTLGSLSNLWSLKLGHNQLEDTIPVSLGNLSNLVTLDLSYNIMHGEVPAALGNCTALGSLQLGHNGGFEGALPNELGNLSSLWKLTVDSNQITALPSSIGNLASLTTLDVSENNLSSLPGSITSLTPTTLLDVGYNSICCASCGIEAWLDEYDPDWEETQIGCDTAACPAGKGLIYGAWITYKDADEIIIGAGYGDCNGNDWSISGPDTLDVSDAIPTSEDFLYIYIDDDESWYPSPTFIADTAEPEYSSRLHGLYNGDDRCIGAVWVTADTITAFSSGPDGAISYDGPTILNGANPTGTYQTIENSSNYSPVNAIAVSLRAQTADASNNCLILAQAEEGYERIVEYGRKEWIAAWGWIHFNGIGGSRNVKWIAPDDDDNGEVVIRIFGFKITR